MRTIYVLEARGLRDIMVHIYLRHQSVLYGTFLRLHRSWNVFCFQVDYSLMSLFTAASSKQIIALPSSTWSPDLRPYNHIL